MNQAKKDKTSHRTQKIIIHIFSWTCFFILPSIVMGQMGNSYDGYDFIRSLGFPLTSACIFYINYWWFAPYYLKKNNYITYIIINVFICIAMSLLLHEWFEFWRTFPQQGPETLGMHPEAIGPQFPDVPPPPPPGRAGPPRRINELQMRDFSLYVMIAVLAIMIRISQRWRKAEAGRKEAELARIEAEIQNLRNQINPHFLLNTLNNIYALISFDKEKAQEAVQDLSRLLRYLLYENNHPYVSLHQELTFLNHYIDLMKIRLQPEVELTIHQDIPEGKQYYVAPLIFISLLENAFKHGISTTAPSFLHIDIETDSKDNILFMVENSNHPKPHHDIHEKGIGLTLVQKRLNLSYPNNTYTWTRTVSDDGKVYRSTLKLKNLTL